MLNLNVFLPLDWTNKDKQEAIYSCTVDRFMTLECYLYTAILDFTRFSKWVRGVGMQIAMQIKYPDLGIRKASNNYLHYVSTFCILIWWKWPQGDL